MFGKFFEVIDKASLWTSKFATIAKTLQERTNETAHAIDGVSLWQSNFATATEAATITTTLSPEWPTLSTPPALTPSISLAMSDSPGVVTALVVVAILSVGVIVGVAYTVRVWRRRARARLMLTTPIGDNIMDLVSLDPGTSISAATSKFLCKHCNMVC